MYQYIPQFTNTAIYFKYYMKYGHFSGRIRHKWDYNGHIFTDEESEGRNSFSYSRQRSRGHHRPPPLNNTLSDQVQIDVPDNPDDFISQERSECDEESDIPAEPLKTLLSALFMVDISDFVEIFIVLILIEFAL